MKRILPLFLLFVAFSTVSNGQDSIVGIYNMGSLANPELTFKTDGTFEFVYHQLNSGKPFTGSWERVNDSTIQATIDSIIPVGISGAVNKFRCVQSAESGFLWCDFERIDNEKRKFKIWVQKSGDLHDNGTLKSHRKNTENGAEIITYYYSNGLVEEIVELKEGAKHGISLKYDSEGKLVSYQLWKNGKKKSEVKYD